MTTEERISMINSKREQINAKEKADAMTEDFLRENLIREIRSMRVRIMGVIETGNALKKNGFLDYDGWKDERLKKFGYDGAIVAEGFYHHVGLMTRGGRAILNVGFRCGGACGAYDFWTDGDSVLSIHERDGYTQKVPIAHLKQFLREFPLFESAFYAWVDANMA